MSVLSISNERIQEVFVDEVVALGGELKNEYDNENLLLLRALLPQTGDVAKDDSMRAGVALMATEAQVSIYPFFLRKVCSNGAVMPSVLSANAIERGDSGADWAEVEIRSAIQATCNPGAFENGLQSISSRIAKPINQALDIMRLVSANGVTIGRRTLRRIMSRIPEANASEFDLMNAVTSVARDSDEPITKWKLEQLGGKIGAGVAIFPKSPTNSGSRKKRMRARVSNRAMARS